MKTNILLLIGIMLLISHQWKAAAQTATDGGITLLSPPGLHLLSETLASEYTLYNSGAKIKVQIADFAQVPEDTNVLGIAAGGTVSGSGDWELLIGREVIVPIFSSKNPFVELIQKKGISPQNLNKALNSSNLKVWGTLLGEIQNAPLHIYIADEEIVRQLSQKFISHGSAGPEVAYIPAGNIVEAVNKDVYAIGFCRLNSITGSGTGVDPGISLMPVDNNNNGRLDYNEQIYNDPDILRRGVWIGKYPHELVSGIYAVSAGKPSGTEITAFLNWVLTEGQHYVESGGFTQLVYNERQAKLDKITGNTEFSLPKTETGFNRSLLWTSLFVALGLFIILLAAGRFGRKRKLAPVSSSHPKLMNEDSLIFPNGLYFDKSHTWVFMEKNGQVRFGIDDFLPNITGKYTRVSLKNPGDKVKRKEPIVTLIRNGKQINIHAPVSGTIKDINEILVTNPDEINKSPYGEGWIYMIAPSNWEREIKFFSLGGKYHMWIKNEFVRLKDFLACSFSIKHMPETGLVFQEGGELPRFVLQDMEPQLWEDFQNYFIETSDMY